MAEWLIIENEDYYGGGGTFCSECRYGYSWGGYHEPEEFGYCPHCGAKITNARIATWAEIEAPETNEDYIRSLTTEELAEFLNSIYTLDKNMWDEYDPCVVINGNKFYDAEEILDWLKEPVWKGSQEKDDNE